MLRSARNNTKSVNLLYLFNIRHSLHPAPVLSPLYTYHRVFMTSESHKHKLEHEPSEESKKIKLMMTEAQQKVEPKFSTKITLTDEETFIFNTLLDVVKTSGCGSVLRAAGGWVRDKLMGKSQVGDVDIALDNMMGKDFAEKVNEYPHKSCPYFIVYSFDCKRYLANHKQETHTVGVIKSNPDQSKHLETATMHIFGQWLDFVNLRSESYSEDSRIPSQMKIGTTVEDALRRDLTINSMFYNINEGIVEDFTGKGLSDLELGIIRTPLPAFSTFMDDPLRVLRSIRFASRYNFAVDEDLFHAASDERVKSALRDKISRERVGKELEGMLTTNCPEVAFQYIDEMDIHDEVFKLPQHVSSTISAESKKRCVANVRQISRYMRYQNKINKTSGLVLPLAEKRIAILSGLMEPYYKHTFVNPKKKNATFPIPFYIIGESLKLSNKDCDNVNLILKGAQKLLTFVHKENNRKEVGLVLRELGIHWITSLLISFISEVEPFSTPLAHPIHHTTASHVDYVNHPRDPETEMPASAAPLIEKYDAFVAWVEKAGLIGVWDMKLILNGDEMQKLLNVRAGPWMAKALQIFLEWQLDHPDATKKQCEAWALEHQNDLLK